MTTLENQNPITPTPPAPETSYSSPLSPAQPTPPPIAPPSKLPRFSPLAKIKSLLGKIKPRPGNGLPIKRLIILLAIIFLVIIMIAIAVKLFTKKPAEVTATPTPEPTATPEVTIPSAYADDEEVLAIEAALDYLEGELKIVNLREDELAIPLLDWEVSFEK
jgi:hypothetical protein